MVLSEDQRRCSRCASIYDWHKSTSRSLKMTYCSFSCERTGEGFLLEDVLATFRYPVVDFAKIIPALEEVASRPS